MKTFRILIVEDEPWIAMDLETIIIELVTATVVVEESIAATKEALHEALDFAFLDVEVTNGKTFEIAQILERKHVPFVFVSGSPQDQLPFELRSVPFIPKPFHAAQIEGALQAIVDSARLGGGCGRRDATQSEIAVVRLLAGCRKFNVECRKFTDGCAVRPFC
jgi:CheY-like chemotaxis protein